VAIMAADLVIGLLGIRVRGVQVLLDNAGRDVDVTAYTILVNSLVLVEGLGSIVRCQ